MTYVNLPRERDREALLAFLASVSLLVGLIVGLALFLTGLASVAGSLAAGAGAAGLGFLACRARERSLELSYKRWNKAAGLYADWARKAVTGIWYWTVFTAVGATVGGGLRRVASPWRSRVTQPDQSYGDPGGFISGRVARGGLRDFVAWALRSGRAWTLLLLPMLVTLRALGTNGSTSSAPDMYTLY